MTKVACCGRTNAAVMANDGEKNTFPPKVPVFGLFSAKSGHGKEYCGKRKGTYFCEKKALL